MSDNDETAPVPRFDEPPAPQSAPPIAPAVHDAATAYGSAPERRFAPEPAAAPGCGPAPQHGPGPTTAAAPSRPSRRTLAIVAGAIGGVLLVGTGFGTGFAVGHRTAQWDGHGGLVSRLDQRGGMPGPGYAQGRGGQVRPFGGQGVVPRRVAPSPAVPNPAPSS